MMIVDHDDHGASPREPEWLTADFAATDDAWPIWRALYVGTQKLADDLMEHVHTESNVLFPRLIG
jgi:regulator of cell morphogenesis and NO signaling